MHITTLPREIIIHIIRFIPPSDLATNIVCVSKLFGDIILDPWLWKSFCERFFGIGITGNLYYYLSYCISFNWLLNRVFSKCELEKGVFYDEYRMGIYYGK